MIVKKTNCPVCNNPMFNPDDFPGSYVICKICGWEDDNLQYYDPNYEGGANDVSLNQAKKNYKLYGIIDPSGSDVSPRNSCYMKPRC